jgi:hypothetical protein
MLRNKLVRSDGSIIDSSVIISCEFTEDVNSSTNLSVGNATASELTVEMLSTSTIQQGEVLTYYIIEDGVETKIGVFNADKPTMATRTSMRFSAYDNLVKTEKVFSNWLRENQSNFPMTLWELVQHACTYCGVTIRNTDFPNAGLPIEKFYADNLTCRQVLVWAGAIAGRFVRANADGELEFAWYRDMTNIEVRPSNEGSATSVALIDDGEGNISVMSDDIEITDDGEGNVSIATKNLSVVTTETGVALVGDVGIPYFGDSLSYENYFTDFIERVLINHSDEDVGTTYPADSGGNCFTISENMILGVMESATLSQVAADLFYQLKDVTYVPCSVTVPRTIRVRAGDVIRVTNSDGYTFITYVMKVALTPSGTTLTATGDKAYGSNAAVSSEKYSNLTGKILAISKTIDGLTIENKNLAGEVGSLKLTTEKFETEVSNKFVSADEFGKYQETVSTKFTETADAFNFEFKNTKEALDGVKGDVKADREERTSYIRFVDGNIVLGRSDSDILLIQKNDRISFVRNVDGQPEVAWFSDDVLHVTEGEFLTQLRIGKFGFFPGANGNLSFRKVVT